MAKQFFKYVADKSAMLNTIQGKLKFATIESLNDPMEFVADSDAADFQQSINTLLENGVGQEHLEALQLQQNILDQIAPDLRTFDAPNSVEELRTAINDRIAIYENSDLMLAYLNQVLAAFKSKLGIFCVSTRSDCLPMWAFYADNARGFQVEISDLPMAMADRCDAVLIQPTAVHYATPRPLVNFDPCTAWNIFLSKLEDWSYEAEWRAVADLSQCEKGQDQLHLLSIDPNVIKAVTLGWLCTVDDILLKEIREANPNIAIYKCEDPAHGYRTTELR